MPVFVYGARSNCCDHRRCRSPETKCSGRDPQVGYEGKKGVCTYCLEFRAFNFRFRSGTTAKLGMYTYCLDFRARIFRCRSAFEIVWPQVGIGWRHIPDNHFAAQIPRLLSHSSTFVCVCVCVCVSPGFLLLAQHLAESDASTKTRLSLHCLTMSS